MMLHEIVSVTVCNDININATCQHRTDCLQLATCQFQSVTCYDGVNDVKHIVLDTVPAVSMDATILNLLQ